MHVPNISNPNLAAFNERLNSKKKTDVVTKLAQLRSDSGLRGLLPHLITHLADPLKLKDAEHIAHFLMGRISSLPLAVPDIKDSKGNAYVVSSETKEILDDVLRTHRYLFSEDATKTLAKLQQIDDGLKKLDSGSKLLFSRNLNQLKQSVEEEEKSIGDESIKLDQAAIEQSQLLEIFEERKEDSDEEQPQDNTNKQIQIPRKLLNQGQWLSQSGYHILDDENDMTSKLYKSNVDKQDQCKKQQDKKKQAIQSKKAQQKQSQIRQEENQSQIQLEEEQLQIKKSLLNKSAAKKINEQTILKKSEAKKINEQSGLKQSLLEKSRLNQSMLSSGFEVVELSANAKKAREVNQLIAGLVTGANISQYSKLSDNAKVQDQGPLDLGDADRIARKFIYAALGLEPSFILKPNSEYCNERVFIFKHNGVQLRLGGRASGSYEVGNLLTMLDKIDKTDELEGKLKVPTLDILVGGAMIGEQAVQWNKLIDHAMLLIKLPGKDKFTEVDPKSNKGRLGSAPNIIPTVKGEKPQVAKDHIEEETVPAGFQSLYSVSCVRHSGTLAAIFAVYFLTNGKLPESVAEACKDIYKMLHEINGGRWRDKGEVNSEAFANNCQRYPDSETDTPLEVIDIGGNFVDNHMLLELDMSGENLPKIDDIKANSEMNGELS